MLLEQARLSTEQAEATNKLAAGIAEKLRNQKSASGRAGIVRACCKNSPCRPRKAWR